MGILPPLNVTPDATTVLPDPPQTCEACGLVIPDGSKAINVIITVGVAGDPNIQPFQCPQIQHWACCPDHMVHVAIGCLIEHVGVVLKYHHTKWKVKAADKKAILVPIDPATLP